MPWYLNMKYMYMYILCKTVTSVCIGSQQTKKQKRKEAKKDAGLFVRTRCYKMILVMFYFVEKVKTASGAFILASQRCTDHPTSHPPNPTCSRFPRPPSPHRSRSPRPPGGTRGLPGLLCKELYELKKVVLSQYPQYWKCLHEFEGVWKKC